jgi:hypothetical protein
MKGGKLMKKFIFLLILPLFLGSVFSGCCHMKKAEPAPVEEVAPPPPPPPAPAPAPEPMQEKG